MPSAATEPIRVPAGFWQRADVAEALDARDIGALFRLLKRYTGASQHRIGAAVDIPQSEISLIVSTGPRHRRITAYNVFERIAAGLDMPNDARKRLGLAEREEAAPQQAPAGLTEATPTSGPQAELWRPSDGHPFEPATDTVVLRLQFDGKEVAVRLSRRILMQAGIGTLMETFALGQQSDSLRDVTERPSLASRVQLASPAHFQEILVHLREQWHALVKTDNLLGPRFALAGVLGQVEIVEALLPQLRDTSRTEAVTLGAQYAESAAWLYEDSGNLTQARHWTSRAMEWAYEAGDTRMLAWTAFRRSQQAAAVPDAAQAIGLAQAARRDEAQLATPTRAAIRVQEAYAYGLDGDEPTSQRLLDEAHTWAASDTVGDAHEGHGSYCTPSYIEIQRASCWQATGKPKKAITLYEEALRTLPPVYQRNRAGALSQLAEAYLADGQFEQAANTAHAALPVARSSGAGRIAEKIKGVGVELAPHQSLQGVAALLDDLRSGNA
jgi:tetratricopeptide (TPR) repeat protein